MLNLIMGILAFLVCLAIIPAFALAFAFTGMIPFFGVSLIGQLWAKGREEEADPRLEGKLETLDDWRKRQLSTEEEVWRHTG